MIEIIDLVDALLAVEVEYTMHKYAGFSENELCAIAEEIERRGPSARSATHLAAACRPESLETLLNWAEFGDSYTRNRALDAVERLAFAFPDLHDRIVVSYDKFSAGNLGLTSKWCRILSTVGSPACKARLRKIGSEDAMQELAALGDISVIGTSPSVDRELASALYGHLSDAGRKPSLIELRLLLQEGKIASIWNLIERSLVAEDMKSILRDASRFACSRSQRRFAKRVEDWAASVSE